MPGDNIRMGVELITPVAIEEDAVHDPRGRADGGRRRRDKITE